MTDSATVVESKKNRDAVESAVQSWLTDNSGVTSVDGVAKVYEMRDRVGVLITYTA
jgi:hypothetical protein